MRQRAIAIVSIALRQLTRSHHRWHLRLLLAGALNRAANQSPDSVRPVKTMVVTAGDDYACAIVSRNSRSFAASGACLSGPGLAGQASG